MKVYILAHISLFALVACTAQQPPPSPQGTLTQQQWLGGGTGPTVVGGSASDTTTAFDGTYRGLSNRSASAAGTGLKAFEPTTTGCQQFEQPPDITISNGLAQFQVFSATFAGYVTPQGHLRMSSGYGPVAEVDFDPRTNTFRGRVISINCRYDLAWQKTA